MPDPKTFEPRLADALRRYARRAPTDVDAMALAREIATASAEEASRRPSWWPFGRTNPDQVRSRTMFTATRVAAATAVIALGSSLALFSIVPRTSNEPANPPATIAPLEGRTLRGPSSHDGLTAGVPTDLLIDLGTSPDPTVPGRTLEAGHSIRITLPEEFVSGGLPTDVPSACDATAGECNTGYLLQGWPQSYFPTTTDYYTVEMDGSHTFVFTAMQDLGPSAEAPGIKQIHLQAPGFTNPGPGEHIFTIEAETAPGGELEQDTFNVVLASESHGDMASTSVFTAPGELAAYANPVYQQTTVGEPAPRPLDILMWFQDEAWVDVEVFKEDETHGELHQASKGITTRYTISDWQIEGPEGATGHTIDAEPSVLIESPLTGEPVGHLRVNFTAGDLPGRYVVKFNNYNSLPTEMVIDVTE